MIHFGTQLCNHRSLDVVLDVLVTHSVVENLLQEHLEMECTQAESLGVASAVLVAATLDIVTTIATFTSPSILATTYLSSVSVTNEIGHCGLHRFKPFLHHCVPKTFQCSWRNYAGYIVNYVCVQLFPVTKQYNNKDTLSEQRRSENYITCKQQWQCCSDSQVVGILQVGNGFSHIPSRCFSQCLNTGTTTQTQPLPSNLRRSLTLFKLLCKSLIATIKTCQY